MRLEIYRGTCDLELYLSSRRAIRKIFALNFSDRLSPIFSKKMNSLWISALLIYLAFWYKNFLGLRQIDNKCTCIFNPDSLCIIQQTTAVPVEGPVNFISPSPSWNTNLIKIFNTIIFNYLILRFMFCI